MRYYILLLMAINWPLQAMEHDMEYNDFEEIHIKDFLTVFDEASITAPPLAQTTKDESTPIEINNNIVAQELLNKKESNQEESFFYTGKERSEDDLFQIVCNKCYKFFASLHEKSMVRWEKEHLQTCSGDTSIIEAKTKYNFTLKCPLDAELCNYTTTINNSTLGRGAFNTKKNVTTHLKNEHKLSNQEIRKLNILRQVQYVKYKENTCLNKRKMNSKSFFKNLKKRKK